MSREGNAHTCEVCIANGAEDDREFVIEPWGDVYTLPPGKSFVISFRGPWGVPEVSISENCITVFGWPGSAFRLTRDDDELRDWSQAVPDVPDGMTTRQFLDTMLGSGTD
jgi:hypothetical protein